MLRAFSRAMAMARPKGVKGPPLGFCLRSYSSISIMASATGFLFGLLTRPISRVKRIF